MIINATYKKGGLISDLGLCPVLLHQTSSQLAHCQFRFELIATTAFNMPLPGFVFSSPTRPLGYQASGDE